MSPSRDEVGHDGTTTATAPSPSCSWTQAAFATSIFTLWREWRARRAQRAAEIAANPRPARSVAAIVRAVGLPDALGHLVERTTRRTRLRRGERREIARELARHLRDGLDAGVAPDELAARFGDPARTARLLRASTLAKRSLVDRGALATLKWGGLALGTLAAVYLAIAARIWMLEPRIAFDPVERLGGLMPKAPEAELAWPRYRDAMRWTVDWRLRHGMPAWGWDAPWAELLDPPSKKVTREEAIAELDAHSNDLAVLRAATSLPPLGAPLSHAFSREDSEFFGRPVETATEASPVSAPATQIPLVHLTALSSAVRWLAADARLSAERNDGARAVDDLVAMLGIARHAGESRFIVSQLTQLGVLARISSTATELLEEHTTAFDDAALARLDTALATIPPSTWRPDFAAERVMFDDMVQRTYSDDGAGDGVFVPERAQVLLQTVAGGDGRPIGSPQGPFDGNLGGFLAAPVSAAVVAGRRDTLDRYQALVADIESRAARPLWELDAAVDPRFLSATKTEPLLNRYAMVDLLAPAIKSVVPALALTRARIDALRTTIALVRFHRAEGRWPNSVRELVPRFAATIPIDPFDGQPIRYALREGRPLLWFVGTDRKDDGGRAAVPATSAAPGDPTARMIASRWVPPSEIATLQPPIDGDWIVFMGGE